MHVSSEEQVSVLKEQAFEWGVFVSEVTSIDPAVEVDCKAVVFGKNMRHTA